MAVRSAHTSSRLAAFAPCHISSKGCFIIVETLTRRKVKKIVTPCPHCYNTLKNEYPQFGGQYEVQHHSTLLAELVGAGRLSNGSSNGEPITLHDPCYLARVNGEVDATRAVIGDVNGDGMASTAADLHQVKRDRGQQTDSSNIREDVNASGYINYSDVHLVESQVP